MQYSAPFRIYQENDEIYERFTHTTETVRAGNQPQTDRQPDCGASAAAIVLGMHFAMQPALPPLRKRL